MNPKKNPILIFFFIFIMGLILFFIINGIKRDPESNDVASVVQGDPVAVSNLHSQTQLIPDPVMVYGVDCVEFSVAELVSSQNGYLAAYSETVDGVPMAGAAIIQKVAENYSVNPKVLLALIEVQSGWLSRMDSDPLWKADPLGDPEQLGQNLFVQVSRTADLLNFGFYARKVGAFDQVTLLDGTLVYLPEDANPGTAGIYSFFGTISTSGDWQKVISDDEFRELYQSLFGDPFQDAAGTSVDSGQPKMQLPFESGKTWAYTGGPHAAWGRYSAWAALDFAPPKDEFGCVQSDEWVTAVADGVITRSDEGVVVLDLDGDGYEQTGWVLLYLHIETRDRIAAGTRVIAGQRIGHPSCEGGYSTGTHVHLARKYNGEWIPADQDQPFILDGWVSGGTGIEYNGTLAKGDQIIEALDGRQEKNSISR